MYSYESSPLATLHSIHTYVQCILTRVHTVDVGIIRYMFTNLYRKNTTTNYIYLDVIYKYIYIYIEILNLKISL